MASKARGRGLQEEDAFWLNMKLWHQEGMLAVSRRMVTQISREANK